MRSLLTLGLLFYRQSAVRSAAFITGATGGKMENYTTTSLE